MGKPFANSVKIKEATPSQSHQAKIDMYKAVMKRKLAREDYFRAQFKVRNILEAAVNSDKEKFKEIFTIFNMFKDFENIIVSYNRGKYNRSNCAAQTLAIRWIPTAVGFICRWVHSIWPFIIST